MTRSTPSACGFVGHRVSAEFPEGGRGSVTIEQNDIDVDAKSTLRMTQQFPPKYEHRDTLNFTMIFDPPEGEPMVTITKEPMVLIGQLTQCPPRGDLHQPGMVPVLRQDAGGSASAVEHRPADVVAQSLVVEDELANRLRELVALPLALESPRGLTLVS